MYILLLYTQQRYCDIYICRNISAVCITYLCVFNDWGPHRLQTQGCRGLRWATTSSHACIVNSDTFKHAVYYYNMPVY